ncbi:hypothetical protein BCR33DRAFT_714539 [Rhizoclosmatium globosum]|uniref:SAM domain-containing protein n=1 Tax=Rhizoclosmatium globosum TaxID=329046 RepID=A0A1Y2CM66_9FUNG|nr:hypothetical protein BCR33DRAFT_714539 [Rhizoclosmatium globosum]|eukprot:ORY48109.1 hypothetical protein BCR33DRAFT_714539 [Rhizoclosmatium globosum]
MSVQKFRVVGRGENLSANGAIIAYAGWGADATLEAQVELEISDKLRSPRIQAEFRGITQTYWESLHRLASRPASETYPVNNVIKVFQHLVNVVYDSPSLVPNPNRSPIVIPFRFALPRRHLPPSFYSVSGVIDYFIKVTLTYSEGFSLLKKTKELVIPVQIFMPDSAKLQMIATPNQLTHEGNDVADRIYYTLTIPKLIVYIGDAVEVNLVILSTPVGTRLRKIHITLNPIVAYQNNDRVANRATFPRPMAEIVQGFDLLPIGNDGGAEPLRQQYFLDVDAEIAPCTFESPLISSKTFLRLEMTLDNSEVPNIVKEIPIIVLPRLTTDAASVNEGIMTSSPKIHKKENLFDTPFFQPSSLVNADSGNGRSGSPVVAAVDIPLPPRIGSSKTSQPAPRNSYEQPSNSQTSRRASEAITSAPLTFSPTLQHGNMIPTEADHILDFVPPPDYTPLSEFVKEDDHGSVTPKTSRIDLNGGGSLRSGGQIVVLEGSHDSWGVEQVAQWVLDIGGTQDVADRFVENAIDGTVLISLSPDDLKNELGVKQLGIRKKMELAIAKMKETEE